MKNNNVENNKSGVPLRDIYIGKVVLIKEIENTEEKRRSFTNIKIRKIVFALNGDEGIDISQGLNKNSKYTYKVINNDNAAQVDPANFRNNTLVIKEPKKISSFLISAGFPNVVGGKDIKSISKLLLSNDKKVNIHKHFIRLNGSYVFNVYQVEQANEEAIELYEFKKVKLPTRLQKIEKVYKKHFK